MLLLLISVLLYYFLAYLLPYIVFVYTPYIIIYVMLNPTKYYIMLIVSHIYMFQYHCVFNIICIMFTITAQHIVYSIKHTSAISQLNIHQLFPN